LFEGTRPEVQTGRAPGEAWLRVDRQNPPATGQADYLECRSKQISRNNILFDRFYRCMRYPHLNDARRAAEMRVLAGEMNDVESRAIMLNLAAHYDKLAIRAEEGSRTSTPGPSPIRE